MIYSAKAKTATYVGHELNNGVIEFLGIPYAKPPERWKRAESLQASNEVFEAKENGPACWQPIHEEEWTVTPPMSEDCLHLNIWLNDMNKTGKAVMVWIHGGSYATGSNRTDCYNSIYCGDQFVKDNPDIIYVSINYRLNAFASMDLSKFDKNNQYSDSTNLQTHDQIEALKWVSENIEAFGGDPQNITVLGQSAGGMSVATLLSVKEANQYFKNVICQSTALSEAYLKPKAAAAEMADKFFDILGANSMDDLLAFSAEEIRNAGEQYMMSMGFGEPYGVFSPCWGYGIFPKNPLEDLRNGVAADKNLMIGTVAGEFDTAAFYMSDEDVKSIALSVCLGKITDQQLEQFINNDSTRDTRTSYQDLWNDMLLREGSVSTGEAQSESGANVYMYYIPFLPEGAKIRPQHCFEIPYYNNKTNNFVYMMNKTGEPVQGKNPSKKLQVELQSCWANFVRNGNPNNENISIQWLPYNSNERYTAVIDYEWSVEKGVRNNDMEICFEIRDALK